MENPMPSFLHYFLRRAGIRIDLLRLRAVYDRHPLPHSIRSLSDTLDELCIPNMICRLEFDQLSELDGPFLVVSGNAEYVPTRRAFRSRNPYGAPPYGR